MKTKVPLLAREVKKDKRGLFIFYGGFRCRPSRRSKVLLGEEVILESPYCARGCNPIVWVRGHRRLWKYSTTTK